MLMQSTQRIKSWGKGSVIGCGYNYVTNEIFFTNDGEYKGKKINLLLLNHYNGSNLEKNHLSLFYFIKFVFYKTIKVLPLQL